MLPRVKPCSRARDLPGTGGIADNQLKVSSGLERITAPRPALRKPEQEFAARMRRQLCEDGLLNRVHLFIVVKPLVEQCPRLRGRHVTRDLKERRAARNQDDSRCGCQRDSIIHFLQAPTPQSGAFRNIACSKRLARLKEEA